MLLSAAHCVYNGMHEAKMYSRDVHVCPSCLFRGHGVCTLHIVDIVKYIFYYWV